MKDPIDFIYEPDYIVSILASRYYLYNAKKLSDGKYQATVLLDERIIDVFLENLFARGSVASDHSENTGETTVILDFKGCNAHSIAEDLDNAYQIVIQYLDYRDLKREYDHLHVSMYLSS